MSEKSWQAWVEKGRANERRTRARALVAVKCVGLAGLLAAAAFWVFAALAVVYNPVVPLVTFSGESQRAVVVASAGPFVASLVWGGRELAAR